MFLETNINVVIFIRYHKQRILLDKYAQKYLDRYAYSYITL